jgi:probable rRNA maturation factor
MPKIQFFAEETSFKLTKPRKTTTWILEVCGLHGKAVKALSFIFCSDRHLHQINVEYLNHDTLTDIITFDTSEHDGQLEGDIFISVERVKENATKFGNPFPEELHRVIIHGVLHLIGYTDKSKKDKAEMRSEEERCLSLPSVPRETFK